MLIANYLALANWLVRELSIAIFISSKGFSFKTKEHVNKSSPKVSYYHYYQVSGSLKHFDNMAQAHVFGCK